jgi:hypothetical protein
VKRISSFLTLLLLGATIIFASQRSTPAAVAAADPTYYVFRFQELQSLGDVDGALALLTDDAVVSGRGLCTNPCTGKAAIRPEIVRSIGPRNKVMSIAVSPGKVEERLEVRGAATRAAGVDRIISNVTFEFKDDKISAQRSVLDRTDPQTATYLASAAFLALQAPPTTTPTLGGAASITPPSAGDAGLAAIP